MNIDGNDLHEKNHGLVTITADIIAAHVSNNIVAVNDLPQLIASVHGALSALAGGSSASNPAQEPAVAVRLSIKPGYIVCLEDGKRMKMLKHHLKTYHQMTPEQYRQKWGLKSNYPMVSPNYAEQRRAMAKSIGLGTRDRKSTKANKTKAG